jgi:hypothetical protein
MRVSRIIPSAHFHTTEETEDSAEPQSEREGEDVVVSSSNRGRDGIAQAGSARGCGSMALTPLTPPTPPRTPDSPLRGGATAMLGDQAKSSGSGDE